jgi:uncharacterized protein involved in exopolysaccharide biosynthesis
MPTIPLGNEMTPNSSGRFPPGDRESSLDDLLISVLRRRRMIGAFALVGALLGLATAVFTPRKYVASAAFIPQSSDASSVSGLALAASQFGIQVPMSGGMWGPSTYVELLGSEPLLHRIAVDSVAVAEDGGRRRSLVDLLDIPEDTPGRRAARTVDKLRKLILASEDKKINGVRIEVATRWPSVSLALAQRLVDAVSRFNLESRKSQAAAERQFVELQAQEAEGALRAAEDRLQSFLQRNRSMSGSPDLTFARDRLQRDVDLRQSLYTSLMQQKETARIKEVRDTPVITILESPQLPVRSRSRGAITKFVLGGIVATLLAILLVFVVENVSASRGDDPERREELLKLAREAIPPFVRRGES